MNKLTHLAVSLSLLGLVTSLPLTTVAATNEHSSAKVAAHVQQKVAYLFVLRAGTGVITKSGNDYTLKLKDVDDTVLYFSDRPVRKSGFIPLSLFMRDWSKGKDSFQANPPNAAIVHAALVPNSKGVTKAVAVKLAHPQQTSGGWEFQIKDLHGQMDVGTYSRVSIFVDSGVLGLVGDIAEDEEREVAE